ncbi:hypothetical protein LX36DRAFT_500395 [Colletotrichum falcatum]|nr:hypothetical protein LX36DRAFT_500395 [Colletotrichum falcatum]
MELLLLLLLLLLSPRRLSSRGHSDAPIINHGRRKRVSCCLAACPRTSCAPRIGVGVRVCSFVHLCMALPPSASRPASPSSRFPPPSSLVQLSNKLKQRQRLAAPRASLGYNLPTPELLNLSRPCSYPRCKAVLLNPAGKQGPTGTAAVPVFSTDCTYDVVGLFSTSRGQMALAIQA